MIELMVTVAIAAVLVAIAVPSLQSVVTGRSVDSQAAELLDALHYAHSEALKRSGPVSVCRTSAAARTTCNSKAGTWQYWMVYPETASAGTLGVRDTTEPVLRQGGTDSAQAVWAPTSPAALSYVTFESTGIALIGGTAGTSATIVVNPSLPDSNASFKRYKRQICLNGQGRASAIDGNSTCP